MRFAGLSAASLARTALFVSLCETLFFFLHFSSFAPLRLCVRIFLILPDHVQTRIAPRLELLAADARHIRARVPRRGPPPRPRAEHRVVGSGERGGGKGRGS